MYTKEGSKGQCFAESTHLSYLPAQSIDFNLTWLGEAVCDGKRNQTKVLRLFSDCKTVLHANVCCEFQPRTKHANTHSVPVHKTHASRTVQSRRKEWWNGFNVVKPCRHRAYSIHHSFARCEKTVVLVVQKNEKI